ncbi:eukaryotic translation initiation factor 4E-1-like [Telopea speciosissima]|uniref:eukaryotic translation initiation factor 4E-1-like n=1 Tax=Telopea speciosissima TaxID=54955 RepID=UPI001CC79AB8|nr:eukaryotic translation initiation factor 4E-1-like [Telopea speciosissima]XP_043701379.1 eukaryotic translation initiation factor 4E-1-like [Telopea speciosissima]
MTEELESMKAGLGSKAAEEETDGAIVGGTGAEEPEEGEIVGDDSTSVMASTTVTPQPHPLENSWTFWFDNPSSKSKQASWGASIRPIHTFATVEEFWSLYNNILHPSKFGVGADFYCFKYKIEPKWEDPVCANGGRWTINFPRGKSDTSWLYTLLAMIGEQFDHGDEICGAVVNVRAKQDKIYLWTKNASHEAAQISIGRQWKEFLDYNENIGFICHDDAKKHERMAKSRFSV